MLQELLDAAASREYTFKVVCDGEIDYKGASVADALDAIEAVDEANLVILEDRTPIGWALIINDLDEDERIADTSGWCSVFLDD